MPVVISTTALCSLAYLKIYLGGNTAASDDDSLTQSINAASDGIERYCNGRLFVSRTFTEWLNGSGRITQILPHYPVVSVERVSIGEVDALGVQSDDAAGATEAYVDFDGTTVTLTIVGGTNAGAIPILVAGFTTLGTLATEIEAQVGTWSTQIMGGLDNYESASMRRVGQEYCFEGQAILKIPEESEPEYRVNLEADNEGTLILEGGRFQRGKQNVYVEYTAGYATVPTSLQQICAEVAAKIYRQGSRDTTLKSEKLGDHSWTAFAGDTSDIIDDGIRRRLSPFKDLLPV